MKYVVMLFALSMMFSCQKEELSILQDQQEDNTVAPLTATLQSMVQQVTAHDGSFDNIVDNSSCFSIKFPYICFYNGEPYSVSSELDLIPFSDEDELIPEFPVTLIFTDHSEIEVQNDVEYNALRLQCGSGELDQDILQCVDLVYPFSVALYDTNTTDFETLSFSDDKSVYQAIDNLSQGTLISMNYPMDIEHEGGIFVNIQNNQQLLNQFELAVSNCN